MKLVKKNEKFYLSDGTFSCQLPTVNRVKASKIYLDLVTNVVVARFANENSNARNIPHSVKKVASVKTEQTVTRDKKVAKTSDHSIATVHKMWMECSGLKKESNHTIRDKIALKKNLTNLALSA